MQRLQVRESGSGGSLAGVDSSLLARCAPRAAAGEPSFCALSLSCLGTACEDWRELLLLLLLHSGSAREGTTLRLFYNEELLIMQSYVMVTVMSNTKNQYPNRKFTHKLGKGLFLDSVLCDRTDVI